MKLPQGSAAYGIESRPTIPAQRPVVQNPPTPPPQSPSDDAASIALGSTPPSEARGYTGQPQQGSSIPVSRQSAIGAYARTSAQSNPFAATVASFTAKPETAPQPAAQQPQEQSTAQTQPIFKGYNGQYSAAIEQSASQLQANATVAKPVARPAVETSYVEPRVTAFDDDDEVVVPQTIDPNLEALAVRYVENYARQTNRPLSTDEKQKKISEVAKFYGAPSRSGRLEALVATQDEVG